GVAKTTGPISPIALSRKSSACRWRPVSASYSASYENATPPLHGCESERTGPDHRRWHGTPLSESDGEKLKAVLHILVERAKPRWRTTEKTRAVLPQPPSSEPAAEKAKPEGEREPMGHGRNGAVRFTGARTVRVQHKKLHPGDTCP